VAPVTKPTVKVTSASSHQSVQNPVLKNAAFQVAGKFLSCDRFANVDDVSQDRLPDEGAVPGSATRRPSGVVMSWLFLVASGVLEAVWALALGRTEGFSRLVPTIVFGVALVGSLVGLAMAMRTLPIGTAYAVWVGIGAALTVGYSMMAGDESISPVRVVLIVALVGCVVGLKLTH
jgi:quaternary ammonium compound-resistance protein SugE